jgi:hypothetical protein
VRIKIIAALLMAAGLTAWGGLVASVNACDDLPALPAAVEVAAYRIVVEAVTNTVRHARARCLSTREALREVSPLPGVSCPWACSPPFPCEMHHRGLRNRVSAAKFWRVFATDARRRQPRPAVLHGRVRAAPPPPPPTSTVDPLVRARMRMSGAGSATMHESPAGVAQLAEQPSCKRQVSGSIPLTGSQLSEDFGLLESTHMESNVESTASSRLACWHAEGRQRSH